MLLLSHLHRKRKRSLVPRLHCLFPGQRMIHSPRAFYLLARDELGVSTARSFRSHFGTSIDVCSIVWDYFHEMRGRPRLLRAIHLLWALLFLKTYDTTDVLASSVRTSPNNFRKWIWIVLRLIQKIKRRVVSDSLY